MGRTWRLNKGFLPILDLCNVDRSVAAQRDRRKRGEKERHVNVKVLVFKDRLRERRSPG